MTELIAHRCNDLLSLRHALRHRQGAEYIECDVRTSGDKVLVVCHDPRCGRRLIHKTPLASLTNELLTLESWLMEVKPSAAQIHLDVKTYQEDGKLLAAADEKQLCQLLDCLKMRKRTIVTGMPEKFLRQLRQLCPKIRLGAIYEKAYGTQLPASPQAVAKWLQHILKFHQQVGLEGVFLNQKWLNIFAEKYHILEQVFVCLQQAGIKIDVWTVNEPAQARKLLANRVDWITTDYPAQIKVFLQKIK